MADSRERREINREACAWIAKLHGAEPSEQDLLALRAWMDKSPVHKAEIRKLAHLWGELNVLSELAVFESPLKTVPRRSWAQAVQGWGRVAVAACVLTVLVGLSSYYWPPVAYEAMAGDFGTGVGEQRTVELEDGSTILLNTNSRIHVQFSDQTRHIYLVRGEAHFDVVSDPDRPFRVFSGGGMLRTIGTAFSVHLNGTVLEVTVTEGSVEFNALDHDRGQPDLNTSMPESEYPNADGAERLAVLKAGHSALIDPRIKVIQSIETVTEDQISERLAWHSGVLRFSGDPLHEVVQEISRYTPTSVIIQDPSIRDIRIGGLFKVGELDKMFEALESSFGVRVERVDSNKVYLAASADKSRL